MKLQYLREIALQLRTVGPRALFYLAAAVSDFYIPWSQLVRSHPRTVQHAALRPRAGISILAHHGLELALSC